MEITLRNKAKEVTGIALIDDSDWALVSHLTWHRTKQGYVSAHLPGSGKNGKAILLHRLLLNPEKGKVCDHINGNRLDNRRLNLRVCFHYENFMNAPKHKDNRSGFKGVYWSEVRNRWVATISVLSLRNKWLGAYKTAEEAGAAYSAAAEKLHGKFLHKSLKKAAV